MTDETRGKRAQEILDDEVFIEAEAIAKSRVMAEWEVEKDPAKREHLWTQVSGLRATRTALVVLVSRGTTAAHQAKKAQ